MKTYKNISVSIAVIACLAIASACSSDFLKEELIRTDSTQSFETPEGMDKLAIGMYQTFEFHFNYEWSYDMTNYGTDEMSVGNDATKAAFNNYSSDFNSEQGDVATVWDNMYSGIASANMLVANVPKYYPEGADHNTRLGEGYFVRGFNYLVLASQFGGIPLVTNVVGAQTDYSRNTIEESYELILSDLKNAYDLLPATATETGRLTKWAAAHYLSKASLFRASELNDSWNGAYKTADLENVIKYGKEVIDHHPLCNNFINLWNFTAPDGPNETVSEVVLAAQFSDEVSSHGRYGNQIHLYYPSIYQTSAGLKRDISGDREFSRMRTTNYALDIYDRVNDSRFWKSFITSYRCNNPSAAPKWGNYAPEGKTNDDVKFVGGEEALLYIVNDAGDTRYTKENLSYRAPHTFVRYFSGEPASILGKHGNYGYYEAGEYRARFVALSKFRDGGRTTVADQFGTRDGILARSAEDYLMVAEALGRQGKYAEALPYINALRERAGYADGEDRAKHIDGGEAYKTNPAGHGSGTGFAVYSETNTYYESNNSISVTTAETKSTLKFNSANDIFNSTREFYDVLGASSEADKFIVFILNERSREFMGELIRWVDLSRTKQLGKRWKAFNDGNTVPEAAFDENKHY
ncbi:MAG: RagB/SusD family nutrient uptake outer membrane protein, partial [Tannerella sp.]|nr:RagB/SusD family nutrient uptake outer membrane protein [Tannerella sp.]